jgi:hypothetical protein
VAGLNPQRIRAIFESAILPARIDGGNMHPFVRAAMNDALEIYPRREEEIIAYVKKRISDLDNYPDAGETAFAIKRRYPPIKPKKPLAIPSGRRDRR